MYGITRAVTILLYEFIPELCIFAELHNVELFSNCYNIECDTTF